MNPSQASSSAVPQRRPHGGDAVIRSDQPNPEVVAGGAQQTIAALQAQLRHAQAMAALGELTSTATHEFNNVLMTIINYARLAIRNRDDATRDKSLGKILDAAERASKITGTILAQARNRNETFEPTDLAGIVSDTLVLLEREMNKYRISVQTEMDPDTAQVSACGNQIQRVLLNLMINARQAMSGGGSLSIRLANSEEAGWVELTIRDTGAGIAAEHLPRIFEPFYSTKSGPDDSGKGGTGLGLAACKEIIAAHGGKIRVNSSPGVGTAFTLRLPRV